MATKTALNPNVWGSATVSYKPTYGTSSYSPSGYAPTTATRGTTAAKNQVYGEIPVYNATQARINAMNAASNSRAGQHQFGSSYQTEAQQAAAGGGGGGGMTGAPMVVGGVDDAMQMQRYDAMNEYAANQNNINREAALGLYSPISGYYTGKLRTDPYTPEVINKNMGLIEDRLTAAKRAEQLKLGDIAAQRGGVMGYSDYGDLNRAYAEQLANQIRAAQGEAIDKNRIALENAMSKELALASAQANVYSQFPISPTPPKMYKEPVDPLKAQYTSEINAQTGGNPGAYGGAVPTFEQWKQGKSGGGGGGGGTFGGAMGFGQIGIGTGFGSRF